jgi:hypothetical protein
MYLRYTKLANINKILRLFYLVTSLVILEKEKPMDKNWVIAGKPNDATPIVGGTYEIRHSRKGTFVGTILDVDGEWAHVNIISGKPKFASLEHKMDYDGVTSIRAGLVYLIELESANHLPNQT